MNKLIKYLPAILLLGSLPILNGCYTSEFEENSSKEYEENKYISLTIRTPVSDKIILNYPQYRNTTAIHEEQEWNLYSLNVYLFKKTEGATDDNGYVLYGNPIEYTFQNGEQPAGNNIGTDNGNGTYSLSLNISDDMIGETFKIAMIANDKPAEEINENTTLSYFKSMEATAILESDGQSADILVGYPGSQSPTGFVMSAMAKDNTNSEEITIKYSDIDLTASLLRNVSRIDIFNYTPNLTITGARLLNAASGAFLFKQNSNSSPNGTYFTLLPTLEYQTKFENGISYVAPEGEATINSSRAVNTLKHVFYMYEQENSADKCLAVQIDYRLTELTGGTELNKQITVEFKKETEPAEYINNTRNYLYTIRLGDGKKVDNKINVASLTIDDWITGGDINESVNPDEDITINP